MKFDLYLFTLSDGYETIYSGVVAVPRGATREAAIFLAQKAHPDLDVDVVLIETPVEEGVLVEL